MVKEDCKKKSIKKKIENPKREGGREIKITPKKQTRFLVNNLVM